MTIIPYFSPTYSNSAIDYIPYRNVIQYIQQKSHMIPYQGPGQAERLKIMEQTGIKNYQKFYRRRFDWDNINGLVPIAYLAAIEADLDIIRTCLEFDNDDYEAVRKLPRKAEYFTARISPWWYTSIEIPEEFQEENKAIEYVQSYIREGRPTYAVIEFGNILTHCFSKEKGYTGTKYYSPDLIFTRTHITTLPSSKRAGVRLK